MAIRGTKLVAARASNKAGPKPRQAFKAQENKFLYEGPTSRPEIPEDIATMARLGLLLPKRPMLDETPEQKAARLTIGIARDAKKVRWDERRLLQQLQRTQSMHEDIPPLLWRRAMEEALKEFRKKDAQGQ